MSGVASTGRTQKSVTAGDSDCGVLNGKLHEKLEARIDYYGRICAYCGGPYETLDHILPIDSGGSDLPSNLRPACLY